MIYFKCILAGIAAVLLSIVLLILLLAAWQYFLVFRTGSGGIGAVSAGLDLLLALVFVGVIFCGGFYWQLRRSSAKR